MKVLVLGVTGMLGHKLYQVLGDSFDVIGTIRGDYSDVARYGIFDKDRIIPHINALDISKVEKAIEEARPKVIVNAVGVVKMLEEKVGIKNCIILNALFPHQLNEICRNYGARLIHVSTDCVFSGRKGNYSEDAPADAEDGYGKAKYLGEVSDAVALTIRTSIIGRELASTNGLLEWFISNRGGIVNGYSRAIFNGFPTVHFSEIVADIIANQPDLNGIYHISGEPISKYRLLTLINEVSGLNIKINEDSDYTCDRSLDSTKYRKKTGFTPLSWKQMVEELAQDMKQYLKWR